MVTVDVVAHTNLVKGISEWTQLTHAVPHVVKVEREGDPSVPEVSDYPLELCIRVRQNILIYALQDHITPVVVSQSDLLQHGHPGRVVGLNRVRLLFRWEVGYR